MINLNPRELALCSIGLMGAMQKPDELGALIELVDKSQPKVIVEIGCGNGGTSFAWSKISGVIDIFAIDLPNGPWGGSNIESAVTYIKSNSKSNYTYIPGDSKALVSTLKDLLASRPIDFLFIDGDHSYEGVKADYELYSPLLNKGSVVAFHDVLEHPPETKCEVKKFWDEICLSYPNNSYFFQQEPFNWGGIGVLIHP